MSCHFLLQGSFQQVTLALSSSPEGHEQAALGRGEAAAGDGTIGSLGLQRVLIQWQRRARGVSKPDHTRQGEEHLSCEQLHPCPGAW